MDGRVPRAGGKHVKVKGQSGIVYKESSEEEAFRRWQAGEFLEVERRFATVWRNSINSVDLSAIAAGMKAMGINPKMCKSLEDAKRIADGFVQSTETPVDRLNLVVFALGLPPQLEDAIYERWKKAGYPPFTEYAPYAAYMLTVTLFFHVALGGKLLSKADLMDTSYLFYRKR